MGIGKRGYYSLRDILGYSCKYNLVLSDRGRGKSWAAKWFLIDQPGTFMALYRQSSDMQSAMTTWLEPLLKGDDDHVGMDAKAFEWEGNHKEGWCLKVWGETKGFFRYLTQVNHIKQEVFPDDLNWIWLDEFIPLVYKKLPGVVSEGDALRAIVKTVEHDTVHTREEKGLKPVRVLMFANPFTWNNPMLSYFKVLPRYGIYKVGPDIVCELLEPYTPEKKSSKMTVDEFLGDEVNKNQGWIDQNAFVCNIPKNCMPSWSFRLHDKYFTIYRQEGVGRYYVKSKKGHTPIYKCFGNGMQCITIYGTIDGLKEDETCISQSILSDLQNKAYSGELRFESINTKFDFLNSIL